MSGSRKFPIVAGISGTCKLTTSATALYREMGIADPQAPTTAPASLGGGELVSPQDKAAAVQSGAKLLALVTLVDIVVFFAVLMIGFAYVWRRGDLDWVRAVSRERGLQREAMASGDRPQRSQQSVLSA